MTVYTGSCEWISALEVCPLDQATKNFQNIMFDRIKFYLIQYVIEMKLSQNASEVGRWGHHITFITLSTDETSVIKKKTTTHLSREDQSFVPRTERWNTSTAVFQNSFPSSLDIFKVGVKQESKLICPVTKYTLVQKDILSITSASHFTAKSSIKPEKPL